MKKLSALAAVILAAATVSACGSDSGTGPGGGGGAKGGDVTIGSVHPLSGALAGAGGLMNDGAKLAVDDINADGGIKALDGAKLKIAEGDSQGKADVGQSEAQRLAQDGATALIGTYQSDVTQNVAAVAERGKVPLVIDVAVDELVEEVQDLLRVITGALAFHRIINVSGPPPPAGTPCRGTDRARSQTPPARWGCSGCRRSRPWCAR